MTWTGGTPGIGNPQIGDLAVRRELIDPDTPCADVDAIFRADPALRSVVVRSGAVAHLVPRANFHESLAGPRGYGFALYGDKPVAKLPQQRALLVAAETPCEWVTHQVLADGRESDEEVLVQYADGYGTIAVATLLNHLWTLSRGRARKLDEERRRVHALVDHASDYTLIVDRHGGLKWANVADRAAFPYTNVLNGVHADDISTMWDLMEAASGSPGRIVEGEIRFRFDEGDHRWHAMNVRSLISDPAVRGIVVTLRDVEREHQLHEALIAGATTDRLTGLANRVAVLADSDRRVAQGQQPTLALVDIDGFKAINDRLGHATGDAVLQEISRRLRAVAGMDDTVARIGSDEFAVLTSVPGRELEFGEGIRNVLAHPFEINGASLRLSASTGVATLVGPATQAVDLLGRAELALHEAKSRGRNSVVAFDRALEAAARQREAMRGRLRIALTTNAFALVFQPQMSLNSNQPLRGFEALLRWPDPARGSIPPDEFLPLAEESGEIVEIGRWVLSGALSQLAEWQRFGAELVISVNTSARELAEADFAGFVRAELDRHRIEPRFLELEITEAAFATDDVAVHETLDQLRALGVGLAVDDYGSQQMSIETLRRHRLSTVKVDRQLVGMLDHDPRTATALLRSITDVAHALGMRAAVEGLETAEQTAFARDLGFDLGQGWHCGMPMSAPRAAKLVAVARRDHSAPRRESDGLGPSLESFEATLEAFDHLNADGLIEAMDSPREVGDAATDAQPVGVGAAMFTPPPYLEPGGPPPG